MVILSVCFAHTSIVIRWTECHMDPTINKASTGKTRTVRVCEVLENTTRGPLRALYIPVLAEIRVKIQRNKKCVCQ
jgi:hypothetical protein